MNPKEFTLRIIFTSLCMMVREGYTHLSDNERNDLMTMLLLQTMESLKSDEREMFEGIIHEAEEALDKQAIFNQVGW